MWVGFALRLLAHGYNDIRKPSDTINPLSTAFDHQRIAIADLAELVGDACGFGGQINWDRSKPDGQPRRQLDTRRAAERIGWRAEVTLEEGIRRTVDWWRSEGQVKTDRAQDNSDLQATASTV